MLPNEAGKVDTMIPHLPLIAAKTVLLIALVAVPAAQAQSIVVGDDRRTELALTVYEDGFALVHDVRRADLAAGADQLIVPDLSDRLDTATIRLAAGEGMQVRSLTFEREVLSSGALLRRSLGGMVRVARTNPATGEETIEEAEVLAVSPELVLRIGDRIETTVPGRIVFDAVPDDLRPSPSIVADVSVAAAGERALTLGYLSDGISWKTSYVGRLADTGDRMELTGWALVDNQTGTAYPGARLALVSGEVNRATVRPGPPRPLEARLSVQAEAVADGVALAATGPFYRYALPQTFDIAARQQTQVELFRSTTVPVTRTLRTEGSPLLFAGTAAPPQPVAARLTLTNDEASGLGVPLPAGLFSTFAEVDGQAVFQGGAAVTATPVGSEMEIEIGRSFDVTVERTVLDFNRTGPRNQIVDTTQRLLLKNGGSRAAEVEVVETFRGEWKITRESAAHEQVSAFEAMWRVTVPAGGEASVEYRAQIGPR